MKIFEVYHLTIVVLVAYVRSDWNLIYKELNRWETALSVAKDMRVGLELTLLMVIANNTHIIKL